MLHFNIRSLKKNFTFLNDILMSVQESRKIIAISEKKTFSIMIHLMSPLQAIHF